MIFKQLYFILLITILTTCTKFGENIYVKGKVVNPATGKGIPNVEIALQKKTTFEFSTGYKAVEKVTTDANGDFEIRHLGGLKQYYLNCMYSSDYYPLGWTVNGTFSDSYITKIKKGKKNEVVFQMIL
ncbi:MAG: carboxypeptidase regulatory-like domain-containing protein [Flavobacteriia bacterium]|nr:carboxypeptidase regulatory-like domain-containing protein [Flavobacteriia bacterium]